MDEGDIVGCRHTDDYIIAALVLHLRNLVLLVLWNGVETDNVLEAVVHHEEVRRKAQKIVILILVKEYDTISEDVTCHKTELRPAAHLLVHFQKVRTSYEQMLANRTHQRDTLRL